MQSLPDSLRSYFSWRSDPVKGNQRPAFLLFDAEEQTYAVAPWKRYLRHQKRMLRRFKRARSS